MKDLNLDGIDFQEGNFYNLQNKLVGNFFDRYKQVNTNLELIPESAEISNVSAYLEPLNNQVNEVITESTKNLDEAYDNLVQFNNLVTSKLESTTEQLGQLNTRIAAYFVDDFGRKPLTVSDTFKTTNFIDVPSSSINVDTTNGELTLPVSQLVEVTDFEVTVDRNLTNGLPGCYSEVSNVDYGSGGTNKTLVSSYPVSKDTANMFDGQSSTWLEVERVFVPPTQKINQINRAYFTSEVGVEQDVKKITQDFDWKIKVSWGEEDSVETNYVQFLNPDTTNQDLTTSFVFTLNLSTPQELSFLNLKPLFKNNNRMILNKIEVLSDGEWITIQENIDLTLKNGTNTSLLNELTAEGYTTQVPITTSIEKIKFYLTGGLYLTKFGISHPFKDVFNERRTERNHGLWRTADTWQEWGRVPVTSSVPSFTSETIPNGLVGGILSVGSTIIGANNTLGTLTPQKETGKVLTKNSRGGVQRQKTSLDSARSSLSSLASNISPYVIGLQALDQLVGGLFQVDKSRTTLDEQTGLDVFKAYKSAVCIRELILGRIRFKDKGYVVSKQLKFDSKVKRVALYVEEEVPANWPESQYTTFSVSVDGNSWVAIDKNSTLSTGYVEFENPTQTIYYRVDFSRYTDDEFRTVKLRNITIQGIK